MFSEKHKVILKRRGQTNEQGKSMKKFKRKNLRGTSNRKLHKKRPTVLAYIFLATQEKPLFIIWVAS